MKSKKNFALRYFIGIFLISLTLILMIDIYIISMFENGVETLDKVLMAMGLVLVIFVISYVSIILIIFKIFNKEINYDNLTGLSSRRKLYDDMNLLINKSVDFTVCYIDFNEFKKINDLYGHDAGDALLKEFSRRLKALYFKNLEGYRIGGDEFVVLLKNTDNLEECIENIRALSKPKVNLGCNIKVDLKFAMGIAKNDLKSDSDELIQMADENMYKDKRN